MEQVFELTDRYDLGAMTAFMRTPEVYWSASDALAPQPEQMDLESYLMHPDVRSFAATYKGVVIGYVLFNRRTSIGAEVHCGFHQNARGKIALTFFRAAIDRMWGQGLLKLWGIVPSDNKPAARFVGAAGFVREGVLRNAIVRSGTADGKPPLRDLIILGLSRPDLRN